MRRACLSLNGHCEVVDEPRYEGQMSSTKPRILVARLAATSSIGPAAYLIFAFTQADFRPQWRGLYLALAFTFLMLVGAASNGVLWVQTLVLVAYTAIVGLLGFACRAWHG